MGVALRRADRQPGRRRRSRRTRRRSRPSAPRRSPAPAAARRGSGRARGASRTAASARAGSPSRGDAQVLEQRLGAPLGRPASLRDVLARVDDEPMQPGRELGLAAELADPLHELHERLLRRVAGVVGVAEDVQRDPVDALGVPVAERCECALVSVFRAADEDWVRKPLVDERPVGPQVTNDSTGTAGRRLHGRLL